MSTIAIRGAKVRLESVETHNGEHSVVYGELDREWLSSDMTVRVNLHDFGAGKVMSLSAWNVETISDPLEDGIYQASNGAMYRVYRGEVKVAKWGPSAITASTVGYNVTKGIMRKIEVAE